MLKLKKISIASVSLLVILGLVYYTFFTLDDMPINHEKMVTAYHYKQSSDINMQLNKIDAKTFRFSYKSFDGEIVNGQLSYPKRVAESYPVLIGVHAMGRSYPRWWTNSLKGRPTVTQVNKLTQLAHQKGYAVIAIDARYHGSRKKADKPLKSIMMDVTFLGDKTDYVDMVKNSVVDHRVLLDWIEQQTQFDNQQIRVAGYSMGGQISLLLTGLDKRISGVAAIVPPFIDDKLASVAPKNIVSHYQNIPVVLVTATDDENASQLENDYLFKQISSNNKQRIEFEGGHILPENYVTSLSTWL